MALKMDTTTRNNRLDAITSRVGNASLIRVYSGTRPANVAASITGTLLGEMTGGTPFAPAASAGVLTANSITGDSSADATGTATHYRHWQSNGTTAIMDGDAGTSGTDMILNTASIVAGGPISCSAYTITEGMS